MCYPSSNLGCDAVDLHICLELKRLLNDNKDLFARIEESNSGVCCVCGKTIKNANLQRKSRDYLWCSRHCYSYKPKKIIALERLHGKDIREILIETTKNYQNILAQRNALRVSTPYLYQLIRKYFGSDYITFFAEHSIGKRRAVYARKLGQRKSIRLPD